MELTPAASHDEIKRAFRAQIARYHPDKVQHLGQEFQAMAADRAAELTEAYRILSDAGRRAEYDGARAQGQGPATAPPAPSSSASSSSSSAVPSAPHAEDPIAGERGGHGEAPPSTSAQFTQERASRDAFVRKAAVGRFRQALAVIGGYDEAAASGFDVAFAPKSTLFGRGKGARLLGCFVGSVDAASIVSTWTLADKSEGTSDVCVFLMGSAVAPARELAQAIAGQRRKPSKNRKIVLIPVDARNWDAHVPLDAPAVAKTLLERLRSGA